MQGEHWCTQSEHRVNTGVHRVNCGIHRVNAGVHRVNSGIHRVNAGVHRVNAGNTGEQWCTQGERRCTPCVHRQTCQVSLFGSVTHTFPPNHTLTHQRCSFHTLFQMDHLRVGKKYPAWCVIYDILPFSSAIL